MDSACLKPTTLREYSWRGERAVDLQLSEGSEVSPSIVCRGAAELHCVSRYGTQGHNTKALPLLLSKLSPLTPARQATQGLAQSPFLYISRIPVCHKRRRRGSFTPSGGPPIHLLFFVLAVPHITFSLSLQSLIGIRRVTLILFNQSILFLYSTSKYKNINKSIISTTSLCQS